MYLIGKECEASENYPSWEIILYCVFISVHTLVSWVVNGYCCFYVGACLYDSRVYSRVMWLLLLYLKRNASDAHQCYCFTVILGVSSLSKLKQANFSRPCKNFFILLETFWLWFAHFSVIGYWNLRRFNRKPLSWIFYASSAAPVALGIVCDL